MNIEFLIIRTFFENKNATTDCIADTFVIDKGQVHNAIEKAIKIDYLSNKDGNIIVTKKGIDYLSQYKVDKAVILACGMGKRLGEMTKDLPKCFLSINGEKLVERQIDQLKKAGIGDITIMVGYMREKFEYLIDKYNVKLIYNEEYYTKNNLATLYKARDIIQDSNVYICASDVYMTDNIYHKFEIESYYTGKFMNDTSSEWQMIYDKDNKITKVLICGQGNGYIMVGPAFFTKEFINKFIPLIEKAYLKKGTENYYWENVLVENIDYLPNIYLYKLSPKTIYEFDKIEDIDNFYNEK